MAGECGCIRALPVQRGPAPACPRLRQELRQRSRPGGRLPRGAAEAERCCRPQPSPAALLGQVGTLLGSTCWGTCCGVAGAQQSAVPSQLTPALLVAVLTVASVSCRGSCWGTNSGTTFPDGLWDRGSWRQSHPACWSCSHFGLCLEPRFCHYLLGCAQASIVLLGSAGWEAAAVRPAEGSHCGLSCSKPCVPVVSVPSLLVSGLRVAPAGPVQPWCCPWARGGASSGDLCPVPVSHLQASRVPNALPSFQSCGALCYARPGDAHPGDARPSDACPGDARPGDAHPSNAHPSAGKAQHALGAAAAALSSPGSCSSGSRRDPSQHHCPGCSAWSSLSVQRGSPSRRALPRRPARDQHSRGTRCRCCSSSRCGWSGSAGPSTHGAVRGMESWLPRKAIKSGCV